MNQEPDRHESAGALHVDTTTVNMAGNGYGKFSNP
jgi:hypothetical protein